MASLYTQKDTNIWKTWLLMTTFLLMVIGLGWVFSWYFNSAMILWVAVAFAITMNIFAYWQSDKVAIRATGAQPADETQYRDLHRIVENLSITAGLPKPRVYVIHDAAPNAFATGRNPENSAIAVTVGLLDRLDRSELEGVIAHELAHIGNRDILIMTVAVVLVGFISILADFFLRMSLFGGMGGRGGDRGGGIVMLIAAVVAIIVAPLAAQLMKMAISRRREFLADASGALLTRYPDGLARALEKISGYSAPMQKANHATAHMFISDPFGKGGASRFVGKLFATHPPVEERIQALRGKK